MFASFINAASPCGERKIHIRLSFTLTHHGRIRIFGYARHDETTTRSSRLIPSLRQISFAILPNIWLGARCGRNIHKLRKLVLKNFTHAGQQEVSRQSRQCLPPERKACSGFQFPSIMVRSAPNRYRKHSRNQACAAMKPFFR